MLGYTLGQVNAFAAAIARRERQALHDMALAARVAQYDQKSWKDFINMLDK